MLRNYILISKYLEGDTISSYIGGNFNFSVTTCSSRSYKIQVKKDCVTLVLEMLLPEPSVWRIALRLDPSDVRFMRSVDLSKMCRVISAGYQQSFAGVGTR
jgi:hypothetical protein